MTNCCHPGFSPIAVTFYGARWTAREFTRISLLVLGLSAADVVLAQASTRVQDSKTYEKQACRPSKYSSRPVCPVVVVPKSGPATTQAVTALGIDQGKGLVPLGEDLLQIALEVESGRMACEFGIFVSVTHVPGAPGYFKVNMRHHDFTMTPVISASGAVRLEDKKAGAVWLQLGHKSMLMSQKLGTRLADDCASPKQAQAAVSSADRNATDLLDGLAGKSPADGTGMVFKAATSSPAKPE